MNSQRPTENTIPEEMKDKEVSRVEEGRNRKRNPVEQEVADKDDKQAGSGRASAVKTENDGQSPIDSVKSGAKAGGKKTGEGEDDVTMTFPQRLMEILSNEEHAPIISWLPHGRGFMIYKKKQFETDVMPHYFNKHSKYTSFTRKLNRWGFVRVTRGPEMGAYYHKFFKRGESRLCMQMSCQRPSGMGAEGFGNVDAQPAAAGLSPQIANLQQQAFGGVMPAGQNFLQMQQQQHMQLLMRHREQMLQREAMMRSGGAGGASPNNMMRMGQMGPQMGPQLGISAQMMKPTGIPQGNQGMAQNQMMAGMMGGNQGLNMMNQNMVNQNMGMINHNMGIGGQFPQNRM